MRRVASATAALQSLDRSSAGHSALRDESPEPGRQSSNSVHGGNVFSSFKRSPRTARRELPTHEVLPILELSSCAACGGCKATTSLVQLPPEQKEKAAHWRTLPPLPAPTSNREQQAVKGLVTVIGLASFAVLLAETAANFVAPGASTRAPASIVDACAIVVVSCYLGVRRATSHLLARTEKTATPIPPEVSAALRGGADAPALPPRNIVGADGRKGGYYVVTDRWQKFTDFEVNRENIELLAGSCAEFLVHGVDVEGLEVREASELCGQRALHAPLAAPLVGRRAVDVAL